jgi:hypothetical protein
MLNEIMKERLGFALSGTLWDETIFFCGVADFILPSIYSVAIAILLLAYSGLFGFYCHLNATFHHLLPFYCWHMLEPSFLSLPRKKSRIEEGNANQNISLLLFQNFLVMVAPGKQTLIILI